MLRVLKSRSAEDCVLIESQTKNSPDAQHAPETPQYMVLCMNLGVIVQHLPTDFFHFIPKGVLQVGAITTPYTFHNLQSPHIE